MEWCFLEEVLDPLHICCQHTWTSLNLNLLTASKKLQRKPWKPATLEKLQHQHLMHPVQWCNGKSHFKSSQKRVPTNARDLYELNCDSFWNSCFFTYLMAHFLIRWLIALDQTVLQLFPCNRFKSSRERKCQRPYTRTYQWIDGWLRPKPNLNGIVYRQS